MARLSGRRRIGAVILGIVALCLLPSHTYKSKTYKGFQVSLEAQSRKCRCWAEETVWLFGDPPVYLGADNDFIEVNGNENNMSLVSCAGTTCQNFVNNLAAQLCTTHSGEFVRAHWWYHYYEGTTGPWVGTLDQDIPCP